MATTRHPTRKTKVTIVGDSQLLRINEEKINNDKHHQVEIRTQSGMKIKQAVNKACKTDSDVIIVHAASNDLRSSAPEKLASEITNTLKSIQEKNPTSKIAFSSIFRRQDKELNAKATKLDKMLEEELMINGFDINDNNNILFQI